LAHANLLLETAPGRYSLHDLLRAYATELTYRHDDEEQRQNALHRVLDYYLQAAHQAAALLSPQCGIIDIAPAPPGVVAERLINVKTALDWFDAEHRTLLAMQDLALRLGFDAHAWQLAWALSDFLARSCRWPESHAVHQKALRAAERASHDYAIAWANRSFGLASFRLGHQADALYHSERALRLFKELGDHSGLGQTYLNLAYIFNADSDYADALRYSQRAHDHYRMAGLQAGQANALNSIGWFHAKLGDYRLALSHCQQALAMLHELQDTLGAAYTMDSLGYIYRQMGDQQQSLARYQQTSDLFREAGEFQGEADALTVLGDIHEEVGDVAAARNAWRQALDILNQTGRPGADQIQARFTRIPAVLGR
jgi:tetratricopeptide (TPR) repeat protein